MQSNLYDARTTREWCLLRAPAREGPAPRRGRYSGASSLGVLVDHQAAVSAAEAERVGHGALEVSLDALGEHLEALGLLDRVVEVRALREVAVVQHQHAVDCLAHARRAERMAGERLGRTDVRLVVEPGEAAAERLQLHRVAHWRRSAVRVDVVDRLLAADLV